MYNLTKLNTKLKTKFNILILINFYYIILIIEYLFSE